ncbi:hypothetical protein [Polyangium aurulentum]|uniref:hypothetical protein n=1 Tax=Polyangium aurulentum TaxID=2567896 RepID=UPI0010AE5748|nr:hypothetical protein [Polyangium aurulentum]UQA62838.1 hypothetical protein E8A73_021250 [Polyangium aurulentum]
MKKVTIELDDETYEQLDRIAGKIAYNTTFQVPVTIEQTVQMALKRGIPLLNEEAIVRTPVDSAGGVYDPSEPFRPSRRGRNG